jgi:hypothetical protein
MVELCTFKSLCQVTAFSLFGLNSGQPLHVTLYCQFPRKRKDIQVRTQTFKTLSNSSHSVHVRTHPHNLFPYFPDIYYAPLFCTALSNDYYPRGFTTEDFYAIFPPILNYVFSLSQYFGSNDREQKKHVRFAAPMAVTVKISVSEALKRVVRNTLCSVVLCCVTVTDTLNYRNCFVRQNSCKMWICVRLLLNEFF